MKDFLSFGWRGAWMCIILLWSTANPWKPVQTITTSEQKMIKTKINFQDVRFIIFLFLPSFFLSFILYLLYLFLVVVLFFVMLLLLLWDPHKTFHALYFYKGKKILIPIPNWIIKSVGHRKSIFGVWSPLWLPNGLASLAILIVWFHRFVQWGKIIHR